MGLDVCRSSGGFVPGRAASCPHCSLAVRRGVARKLAAGTLGGGAIAFTLMACYGVAAICSGDHCEADAEASDAEADFDSRPDVHVNPPDAGRDADEDADASDATPD